MSSLELAGPYPRGHPGRRRRADCRPYARHQTPGDEVLVARVTQLQDGPIEWYAAGCFRRFESRKGLVTHLGKLHPEMPTRTWTCAGCGEEFEPRDREQRYCSRECYFKHKEGGRVTLICANCDETFVVPASHADDRTHCSKKCQYENPDWPPEGAFK